MTKLEARRHHRRAGAAALAGSVALVILTCTLVASARGQQQGFRFTSSVDLVNVTVTVTDGSGRFVPNLTREDFRVFEDGQPQEITHFSNERVPVSLGIALDTSGSMEGEKIVAARQALDRFLYDLLDPEDEVFLYEIADPPQLLEPWTTDRRTLTDALRWVDPRGGTAMYDAVAEAVPIANDGTHRKKALLIISDGNDTASRTDPDDLKQLIRETEVLVYAIGIDGRAPRFQTRLPRGPGGIPFPIPMPGGGRSPFPWPGRPRTPPPIGGGSGGGGWTEDNRVNADALRDLTDDSGARTEIIRDASDLVPATESIADELSRQYFLAYPGAAEPDGRWHEIRVEVAGERYHVRARSGYVASQ